MVFKHDDRNTYKFRWFLITPGDAGFRPPPVVERKGLAPQVGREIASGAKAVNSSLERPRSRITTSTSVLLNRSNTSVGFNSSVNLNKYRLGPEAAEPLSSVMRGVRDTSCGSDTSSGVFSAASLETHNRVHSCKVTVNGQHL